MDCGGNVFSPRRFPRQSAGQRYDEQLVCFVITRVSCIRGPDYNGVGCEHPESKYPTRTFCRGSNEPGHRVVPETTW